MLGEYETIGKHFIDANVLQELGFNDIHAAVHFVFGRHHKIAAQA